MSPAQMFEHGMARAGYIETPRGPDLAFEFLPTKWRTIPYDGPGKNDWPFQVDPDDITRIYFRDPATRTWHTLTWEHAPAARMPLSEDALLFARKLAAAKYRSLG